MNEIDWYRSMYLRLGENIARAFGEKKTMQTLCIYCCYNSKRTKLRRTTKLKVVEISSEIETKCNKIHISIGLIVPFMILLRYIAERREIIWFL